MQGFGKVGEAPSKKLTYIQDLSEPVSGEYVGVEKTEAYGSKVYVLKLSDDSEMRLIGVTDLNNKMDQLEIGDLVKVSYGGLKKLDNGFRKHLADVEKIQSLQEGA